MKKQKIRIVLRSNDHFQIDKSVKEIVRAAKKAGSKVYGPIPLPTSIKRFTVLRSPNNDKKSREQFEICLYKRLIDIEMVAATKDDLAAKGVVSNKGVMDALMQLQLSSAVDVEIK